MAVILNASTSSGFVQSADTSGVITLQSNGTNAASVSGSNLQFNSGYGSVATAYGCRAWVNFNGQGTVAIRASGNVTSITDNGTGLYIVNFTTSLPDTNYSFMGFVRSDGVDATTSYVVNANNNFTKTASSLSIITRYINPATGGAADSPEVNIAIFR
jgi:hypothetical protein